MATWPSLQSDISQVTRFSQSSRTFTSCWFFEVCGVTTSRLLATVVYSSPFTAAGGSSAPLSNLWLGGAAPPQCLFVRALTTLSQCQSASGVLVLGLNYSSSFCVLIWEALTLWFVAPCIFPSNCRRVEIRFSHCPTFDIILCRNFFSMGGKKKYQTYEWFVCLLLLRRANLYTYEYINIHIFKSIFVCFRSCFLTCVYPGRFCCRMCASLPSVEFREAPCRCTIPFFLFVCSLSP